MTNVDLYLAPGVGTEAAIDALRARFPTVPLEILDQRALRREILAIFDQTFAVTRLLQGMALLIAACGITLTLLVLARERVAELALYRALGAGRRQIFGVFLGEGVGMAILGLLLGVPSGAALAAILILLINRAYFGWTIAFHVPVGALAAQAATILAAATVASVYPALSASRTPASELSRDDL
jgi:putative ABC transport system permease protein